MATRYFAPAGQGTSGSGLTRRNPIYGLSDLSMVQSGDEIVLLSGSYYERFVIPQNNLRIISEEAVFDGTESLNGSARLNTPDWLPNPIGSAWQLVDAGLNVWKKGTGYTGFLFLSGTWIEPMPSSLHTQTIQNILDNIQVNQYSFGTETLNGSQRALYLRLPVGTTPSNYRIS